MTSFAKIENGAVTNVIVLPDGESVDFIAETLGLPGVWVPGESASTGDMYEEGKFVPPEARDPTIQSITRRQGRLALLDVGRLDAVENYIDGIEDPKQRRAAQIEYEADTWERGNQFLRDMWAQLGGTAEQLDDLFVLAATK